MNHLQKHPFAVAIFIILIITLILINTLDTGMSDKDTLYLSLFNGALLFVSFMCNALLHTGDVKKEKLENSL